MSFELASESVPRAKIFLWGESGTGKTTFALRWAECGGKLAVIDLEDSTKRYDREFSFHRWTPTPTTIQEIFGAIDYLSTQDHEFTTLLIDPVTIMYDFVLKYWEDKFFETRPKGKGGHNGSYYELQPLDYKLINKYWSRIFTRLRNMDMNVICTARSKTLYDASGDKDKMMKIVGKTFDSQKTTDYEMDTSFNTIKIKETDQYFLEIGKHRSFRNPMPSKIDITGAHMDFFKQYFGDSMTRKAVPIIYVTQEMKEKIERLLDTLGVTEDKKFAALKKWGVSVIEDLTLTAAQEIVESLEKKISAVAPF